jgi:hypothetical protein
MVCTACCKTPQKTYHTRLYRAVKLKKLAAFFVVQQEVKFLKLDFFDCRLIQFGNYNYKSIGFEFDAVE